MEMKIHGPAGANFHEFRGTIAALNVYMTLRKKIESSSMFIKHPKELGETVLIAKPGIGEIWIQKAEFGYQVNLQRGPLGSLIAGWLGKYK